MDRRDGRRRSRWTDRRDDRRTDRRIACAVRALRGARATPDASGAAVTTATTFGAQARTPRVDAAPPHRRAHGAGEGSDGPRPDDDSRAARVGPAPCSSSSSSPSSSRSPHGRDPSVPPRSTAARRLGPFDRAARGTDSVLGPFDAAAVDGAAWPHDADDQRRITAAPGATRAARTGRGHRDRRGRASLQRHLDRQLSAAPVELNRGRARYSTRNANAAADVFCASTFSFCV